MFSNEWLQRTLPIPLAIITALAGVSTWLATPALATYPFSVTVKNPPNSKHNLKDITVEVIGIPSIDGITNNGPFTASGTSSDHKKAKFDSGAAGAIPPGGSGTVVLNLTHKIPNQGICPVVIDETSWASDPLAFGVSERIFSGAVASGATGPDFAGIVIPPGEFLYLYEVRWLGAGPGPTRLEVSLPSSVPVSMGVLNNSWAPDFLLPVPNSCAPDDTGFVVTEDWTMSPGMLPEYLTGLPGVPPTSWSYSGGKMVAKFASPLNSGDVSAVLWFIDSEERSFGAPDLGDHNAALLDDTGTLFSAAVEAPPGGQVVPAVSSTWGRMKALYR